MAIQEPANSFEFRNNNSRNLVEYDPENGRVILNSPVLVKAVAVFQSVNELVQYLINTGLPAAINTVINVVAKIAEGIVTGLDSARMNIQTGRVNNATEKFMQHVAEIDQIPYQALREIKLRAEVDQYLNEMRRYGVPGVDAMKEELFNELVTALAT